MAIRLVETQRTTFRSLMHRTNDTLKITFAILSAGPQEVKMPKRAVQRICIISVVKATNMHFRAKVNARDRL